MNVAHPIAPFDLSIVVVFFVVVLVIGFWVAARTRTGDVLMAFDGIPLIYMGDEIGLTNDRDYLQDPHPLGRLTALFNFTETPQQLEPPRGASPFDCITERPVELHQ